MNCPSCGCMGMHGREGAQELVSVYRVAYSPAAKMPHDGHSPPAPLTLM